MPREMTLQIAGFSLHISSPSCTILQEPDSSYQSFLDCTSAASAPVCADVFLHAGDLAVPGGARRLFDTEESWSLYRDDADYLLCLRPAAERAVPLWTARFCLEQARVDVFCGKAWFREIDGQTVVRNPVHYPLDQLLLIYFLSRQRAVLVHAAGASLGGRGVIFPGRSGAGKSTISRLLAGKAGVHMLSDDRVVVREVEGAWRAFGTPWAGEAGIAMNASEQMDAIMFIAHGDENRLSELGPTAALERLLPVASIPWFDPETMVAITQTCASLTASVPAYEFAFRPDADAAECLRCFLDR